MSISDKRGLHQRPAYLDLYLWPCSKSVNLTNGNKRSLALRAKRPWDVREGHGDNWQRSTICYSTSFSKRKAKLSSHCSPEELSASMFPSFLFIPELREVVFISVKGSLACTVASVASCLSLILVPRVWAPLCCTHTQPLVYFVIWSWESIILLWFSHHSWFSFNHFTL